MRYVGGKTRIASWVTEEILNVKGERDIFVEPFLGSAAVHVKLAPHFEHRFASDAHEDLMLMWKALCAGWNPPEFVSRERYEELRQSAPSPERGLVGFGSTWGGKWFGGYVNTVYDKHHSRETKPYLKAARTAVLKDANILRGSTLACLSFDQVHIEHPDRTVIYCDPPYAQTLGYRGAGVFDSEYFWKVAQRWAEVGALVVVSEESAPVGWALLAERSRRAMLRVQAGGDNALRSERLFVFGGKALTGEHLEVL